MDKKALRKKLIKMRLDLDEQSFKEQSHLIIEKLKQDPIFKQAKTIGVYLSYNNEVDTWKLIEDIKDEKDICVPIVQGKTMYFAKYQEPFVENRYKILEPETKIEVKKDDIELIIVPLVGYNDGGKRLGYGGGFYDRYLCDYKGHTIGIAFSLQYISDYEVEEHDILIEKIIDEKM